MGPFYWSPGSTMSASTYAELCPRATCPGSTKGARCQCPSWKYYLCKFCIHICIHVLHIPRPAERVHVLRSNGVISRFTRSRASLFSLPMNVALAQLITKLHVQSGSGNFGSPYALGKSILISLSTVLGTQGAVSS